MVLQRFVERCPVAVMARLALGQAIPAAWIDEVFAQHRRRQDTRDLLFSTVVDLMGLVALGMRPSLDGNHLPASEKRLAVLRDSPGAALPGQSLVVFDPELGLVVRVMIALGDHRGERGDGRDADVAPALARRLELGGFRRGLGAELLR